MNRSLGGFRAALLSGWIALSAAGALYANAKQIPLWLATPIVGAFLLEYYFYLSAGFEEERERFAPVLPWFLVLSFLAPYILYATRVGEFRWPALGHLAALALVYSLWYEVLPRAGWADAAFLALTTAVVLRKYFDPIYTSPLPGLHLEILGHLALIRVCAMAMLIGRRVHGIDFGFLPTRAQWIIGIRHFAYFLLVGIPLALALRLLRSGQLLSPYKIFGTFLGILWVVALSEEFFFRGLLQQWLEQWTHSAAVALGGASILFGAVHLGFRGFPNWRFALLAAVAGFFYGRAFREAKSIRASMVTHALVVTLWRAMGA